jgi:hypothetical protein
MSVFSEDMSVSSYGRADLLMVGLKESLNRVSALAATALGTPNASVMFAGAHALPGMSGALGIDDQEPVCPIAVRGCH